VNRLNPIIHWWFVSDLPLAHVFIRQEDRPKKFRLLVRLYFRKWIVHPIKRRVAKYYLATLRQFFGLKVIGITGSSGKTTTKEMLASVLSLSGETVSSYANIDPVYNIPSTMLKCGCKTKYLVLEMGVEYPGEMGYYLWLGVPDVAVITNISPTHTKYFTNVAGVFKEKTGIIEGLNTKGIAVLNREDQNLAKFGRNIKPRVIWFGEGGDCYSTSVTYTSLYKTKFKLNCDCGTTNIIELPVLGKPFVKDALAAVAAAMALKIDSKLIKRGLEGFKQQDHRMQIIKLKSSAIIIDDTYNNNPAAAREVLKVFKSLKTRKQKMIIFGDMLELGDLERQSHEEIGKEIAKIKPEYLVCIGKASRFTANEARKVMERNNVLTFDTWQESLLSVKKLIQSNILVLVKGSRSVGLDALITSLL